MNIECVDIKGIQSPSQHLEFFIMFLNPFLKHFFTAWRLLGLAARGRLYHRYAGMRLVCGDVRLDSCQSQERSFFQQNTAEQQHDGCV